MATIAPTNMQGTGARTVTRTTLTASDTFTYNADRNPVLELDNITAGALTVTIDGADGTTVPVAGVGQVSVAAGFSTGSIAAGAKVAIPLNSISAYLRGVIAVTGGSGISASLLEF
ncbi:MAG TPA: hypothetical protein VFV43_09170 [Limnobacter sp.]|nr:hypothetical protein [Limnobacter sp.]